MAECPQLGFWGATACARQMADELNQDSRGGVLQMLRFTVQMA